MVQIDFCKRLLDLHVEKGLRKSLFAHVASVTACEINFWRKNKNPTKKKPSRPTTHRPRALAAVTSEGGGGRSTRRPLAPTIARHRHLLSSSSLAAVHSYHPPARPPASRCHLPPPPTDPHGSERGTATAIGSELPLPDPDGGRPSLQPFCPPSLAPTRLPKVEGGGSGIADPPHHCRRASLPPSSLPPSLDQPPSVHRGCRRRR